LDRRIEEREKERHIVALAAAFAYESAELLAFAALISAVAYSVYDFFHGLLSEGFVYAHVMERLLLILVFVDLMRTIVGGIVEGRFRMDILLEAITIAIARDVISALALIKEEFNLLRLVVLTGMLVSSTLLWWLARRVERREPGPRLRPRQRRVMVED